MPGMDAPCWALVGLMSAPVAATSTRFHIPLRMAGRICPHSTLAQHPQPEPPACTSCVRRSYISTPQSIYRAPSFTPSAEYRVVIFRGAARVGKVRAKRVIGRRGHGRAHVVCVVYPRVNYPAGRDVRYIRPAPLRADDGRARARHRPLRCGRALAAVFQRIAVLPLRRAEVRARNGAGSFGIAAVNQHRRQRQRLRHGGARAVDPEIRRAAVLHRKRRAHALVEKVPGNDVVQRSGKPCLIAGKVKAFADHMAFGALPALLAEIGVSRDAVEAVLKRAFALALSANRRGGDNSRPRRQRRRLSTKLFHGITSLNKLMLLLFPGYTKILSGLNPESIFMNITP